MMTRIGIIGTGLMGGIHASAFSNERGAKVVGYHNRTRAKAEDLAKQYGGEVFDDWRELVRDPSVDAVVIASPQAVHAEQIVGAVEAGKDVLSEKPLALTLRELDAIEKAVKAHKAVLMVGHQLRFHPVVAAVAKAMRRLGPVYHLDLEWCLRIAGHTGRCWETYRLGGFFMELGCHMTDLSRFLMGPIKDIRGYTLRLNPKRITEDYTHCLLKFENEAVGSIVVSANHRTGRQGLMRGRVLGAKGCIDFTIYPYGRAFNKATLTLDGGKSVFVPDVKTQTLDVKKPPSPVKVYPGFFDVYQRQAHAFLKAVRDRTDPPCTLADGRSAIEVILAVYHEQGKVTRGPNFVKPPAKYRSDADSHPELRGELE